MAKARILVTGATGRVGGALAPLLKRAGAQVVALVRDPARAKPLAAQGIELRQADLADPASLPKALKGIDKAFLATANSPDQAALESNLIQAAAAAGVGHIVKLSAQPAGMVPPRSFGVQHREAEIALELSGVPFTVLRPHVFMQSLLMFADAIRKEGRFRAPIKAGRVALVDVRDVAAVAALCLADDGHKGKAYILTGPRAIDFFEIARLIGQARGRNVVFKPMPAFVARLTMPHATGLPRWHTSAAVDLYVALERGAQGLMTDTIERMTGKKPRSLEAFLKENAAAFAPVG
jgi:uncharacterized protein YbjT (DUF2867 family)